jgi:ribosomal protein S18 acetylase RimI-like enzyme
VCLLLIIRKANEREEARLLQKTGKTIEESTAGFAQNDNQASADMFDLLLKSGAYYLIAQEHNLIKGWILIGQDFSTLKPVQTAGIFSLYVNPEYRSSGIGRKLINYAITELKQQGYQQVQLYVFTGNPAKRLYEQLGFKEICALMSLEIK